MYSLTGRRIVLFTGPAVRGARLTGCSPAYPIRGVGAALASLPLKEMMEGWVEKGTGAMLAVEDWRSKASVESERPTAADGDLGSGFKSFCDALNEAYLDDMRSATEGSRENRPSSGSAPGVWPAGGFTGDDELLFVRELGT